MRHREATFFPHSMPVIAFGADYNPEQWPQEVWEHDVALMKKAGVNLVTVGVFSWATIEPSEGERNFGWLDALLNLLAANDISVDLATPIASPPPWVGATYPQTLAQWDNGYRTTWGSRNHFSPASAKYRELCALITRDLVNRYAAHPAVVMWHVGNEFGQICYSDESAGRFQQWLQAKYQTLENLNHAWGTAFWSQGISQWEQAIPPRQTTYLNNPTQVLDFKRYSSDLMLEMYLEQVAIIREVNPNAVITTNFMGFFHLADYHSWAHHMDVIADDIYPDPLDPHTPSTTALTQELMRSLRVGRPWMVMEQAITSVNWRAHNVPKTPATTRLESLAAIARGSRGICFFQWRQSTSGSERFHSALLPHSGEHSQVHKAVQNLGQEIGDISSWYARDDFTSVGATTKDGPRINARVALIFDWSSWWVSTQSALPTSQLDELETLKSWHRQLWLRGVRADVISPDADLTNYDVVLAPSLHLISSQQAFALQTHAQSGATVVLGAFSAVADLTNRIFSAPFPAHISSACGVRVEEWIPLPPQATLNVTVGASYNGHNAASSVNEIPETATEHLSTTLEGPEGTANTFVEKLDLTSPTTQVRAHGSQHEPDPFGLSGRPLATSNTHGKGALWYLGATFSDATLGDLLETILTEAGIAVLPERSRAENLDIISDAQAIYLLNYGNTHAEIYTADLEHLLGHSIEAHGKQISVPAQDAVLIRHQYPTT